jgi:gliding motility-associated-like protein
MKRGSFIPVVILFSSFLMISFSGWGQNSNKGKDFWMGFMKHRDGTNVGLYLYITSDSSTSVKVEIPGQNWSTTDNVSANQMTLISVPVNQAFVNTNEGIEDRAVHITSQKDVVVYAHMYNNYRSDATLILPTKTSGQEYYVMSYNQWNNGDNNRGRSQFMIVANQDDTKINITPTRDLYNGKQANKTYQITLDQGEVYQARARYYSSSDDLTGTHIEVIDTGSTANCRTVSVFSGSSDTRLGRNCSGWLISSDNLYQQLFPTRSWGTSFITIPFKSRGADDIRVMAAEDNTKVVIYNQIGAPTIADLDAGEFYTVLDADETKYIAANKPISVAQYQQTQNCTNGKGDPSMTILSPLAQTLKDIVVYSSQYEDIDDHYINVIIPTFAASTFTIDGNSASFSTVPRNPNYSYAQITTTKGNHRLKASEGFIAVAYGFGDYESYGYSAGANVKDLRATIELSNSRLKSEGLNAVCLGEPAKFKGAAEYKVKDWVWYFGDGDTSHSQNTSHIYADTGTYQVKLYTYKEDFDGCSNFDSALMEVSVHSVPVAKMSHDPFCEKSTIRFIDSSKAPGGYTLKFTQWQFDGVNVYSKNTTRTYDTTGKYLVNLIVATNKECRDTISDSIYVSAKPVAGFSFDEACFYDTTHFNNTTTLSEGSIDEYLWTFGDGDSSRIENPSHYYQDSGSYEVILSVVSDSGCTSEFIDTASKRAPFVLDFMYQDTCEGLDMDFTNISNGNGQSMDQFFWRLSDGTEYTSKDVQHRFSNSGSFFVTLRARIDTVCVDSTTHLVQVYPAVNANFDVSSACFADTVKFFNSSTVPSGSITSTLWDFDDGLSASDQDTVTVTYASEGSKDVELIAYSDKGCRDTINKTLTFYDPVINQLEIPNFCRNISDTVQVDFDGGLDNASSYQWTIDGNSAGTDSFAVYTSSLPGKFLVELTINTSNGCVLSSNDTLTVYEQPIASFFTNEACENDTIFTSNSSIIGSGEQISEFTWKLNDQFHSDQTNTFFANLAPGTYPVKLITRTPNNCTDSVTIDIVVDPNPTAGISVQDTCAGDVVNFADNSTVASGSITNYTWIKDDGSVAGGSSTSQSHPDAGTFVITLAVESDKNCVDTLVRTYTVAPMPVIDITIDEAQGCVPFEVTLNNASSVSSGSIATFDYDWGDGSQTNMETHTYTAVGNYDIAVTATSDAGCIANTTLGSSITVLPIPTADFTFTPDDPSILNPIVTFTQNSSPSATVFNWSLSDGSSYSGSTIQHTFIDSGTYAMTLVATDDNGCSDSETKTIRVTSDLFFFIPSGFSPNGDGINDEFGLGGLVYGIEGFYLRVFNKWGQKIFETDNPSEKWDGTVNDSASPDGVYVYEIGLKDAATKQWQYMNGVIHVHR